MLEQFPRYLTRLCQPLETGIAAHLNWIQFIISMLFRSQCLKLTMMSGISSYFNFNGWIWELQIGQLTIRDKSRKRKSFAHQRINGIYNLSCSFFSILVFFCLFSLFYYTRKLVFVFYASSTWNWAPFRFNLQYQTDAFFLHLLLLCPYVAFFFLFRLAAATIPGRAKHLSLSHNAIHLIPLSCFSYSVFIIYANIGFLCIKSSQPFPVFKGYVYLWYWNFWFSSSSFSIRSALISIAISLRNVSIHWINIHIYFKC